MDQQVFSLLQVMQSVHKTIAKRYGGTYWIRAEMNKLNHYSHSGHCYPELVEKQNGKVIAQVNSTFWRDDYRRADDLFRKTLNEPLRDGIKILFRAKITFEPVHGLALNIIEIDPAFTLGDLEREKKETLDKLLAQGLLDSNKKIPMPLLPQRIAVISVETSKGYADFLSVIDNNPWGYKFFHMLFPSILQGEKAIPGIVGQLRRIKKVIQHFDAVAIIRGGGGDVGLSVYNDYRIAAAIASFPIPVLAGIGHATNLTASEMVSHTFAITPTKLAETLLQRFHETALPLGRAGRTISLQAATLLQRKKQKLGSEAKLFRSVTVNMLDRADATLSISGQKLVRVNADLLAKSNATIEELTEKVARMSGKLIETDGQSLADALSTIERSVRLLMARHGENLAFAAGQVRAMDPANVLRRGFSITRYNGHAVRDPAKIPPGEEIETELSGGIVKSRKTS